jgi:hypothetical protein
MLPCYRQHRALQAQSVSHLAVCPHKEVGAAQVSVYVLVTVTMQVAHACCNIVQHGQALLPGQLLHSTAQHSTHTSEPEKAQHSIGTNYYIESLFLSMRDV